MFQEYRQIEISKQGVSFELNASLDHSRALKISSLSKAFMSLMKEQNIRLKFPPVDAHGLCAVDATSNPTNAYKVRGALASAELAKQEGLDTLVTASAGNHGAGLAYAAQKLGLKAVIYVPKNAPEVKVNKIRSFGAQVKLVGNSFDECLAEARKDSSVCSSEATFVHPFDDLSVVAGQGTIGYELLDHVERYVARTVVNKVRVVLPIGGGGLVAGVLSVLKTNWPNEYPPLEVIGVVDESSPASLLAMLRGRPVRALTDTIADGTKVEVVGQNFLAVSHLLDGLLLLPHDELVHAMRKYEAEHGSRLEGAGALALAGEEMLRRYDIFKDPARILSLPIISGKNIDDERFEAEVSADLRMDTKVKRRQAFDVVIPEKAGQLLRFLDVVKGYNIASLTYMRRVNSLEGSLRVEFEIEHVQRRDLNDAIVAAFPGSTRLRAGEHMLYQGGSQGTEAGTESLLVLSDRPGSFRTCVQDLMAAGKLGSVDFLFYRKPAKQGALAQVVMGESAPTLDDASMQGSRDAWIHQ